MIILRLKKRLVARRVYRPLMIATIVLATSGCAPLQTTTGSAAPIESRQPGQVGPAVEPQAPAPQVPAPKKIVPAGQTISPAQRAVTSLLKEGWGYYRIESHERSIAIAERAQRLDPQRAEVYLLLAKSYFAIGQLQLAEQLSQRGLLLSQNNAVVQRQLQGLLNDIRG